MILKDLLDQDNLNKANEIEETRKIANEFLRNYNTTNQSWISDNDPRAYIYFNGVSRVEIDGNNIRVCGGYRLEDCPKSELYYEGVWNSHIYKVKVESISDAVNILAKYMKIYPI